MFVPRESTQPTPICATGPMPFDRNYRTPQAETQGGMISAVGTDVTEHKVGDRVSVGTALSFDLTGCYAEKVKRRASEVLSLAESISFAEAATFGVSYPTAHYALFARGDAQGGETVFIHGASGSVGTSAIQLAKRAGLRVVGSAGTSKGLELIRAEGVDHA